MHPVESFIYKHEGQQKEIMLYFYNLLSEQPGVIAKISFGIPFFNRKSWICYLSPKKDGSIELAFTRGNELSNHSGLLKTGNRKLVKGVVFKSLKGIPFNEINEIIQEALLLDEKVPYQIKDIFFKKKSRSEDL
jgi:hypothetical protein